MPMNTNCIFKFVVYYTLLSMVIKSISLHCLNLYLVIGLICGVVACKKSNSASENETPQVQSDVRFSLLPSDETNVDFANNITVDYEYNNFVFEYIYNGGGVAAGDVNGDSLPDLYFSASRLPNKLFLNLGGMKFRDVTEMAGVAAASGFKTGVAMADINGDGRLDIYSCKTSKSHYGTNADEVFIQTGLKEEQGLRIPVFEEQSAKLGLSDSMNTNHVCFLDIDRDGDLDLFQLNHRIDFGQANNLRLQETASGEVERKTKPETPYESNKLFENQNGVFKDVTKKAGVESSAFGLSATPCDINQDGWPDIYVANDFMEPDLILINNKNGTFSDRSADYLRHTSQSSMGSDVNDINNDGLPDIIVVDMKPEDPFRYKEMMNLMQYDRYNLMVQYDYGRQNGRNVLQLNNGNGTFSEIGQYAGVAATDWSWGAAFADYNNDGWKDIFITNGYRKDLTQQDYFTYFRDSIQRTGGLSSEKYPDIRDFLKYLPEKKIPNYLYINNSQCAFVNASSIAGVDQPSFSSGYAYADLDRDGDLDIIVNNIDAPAFIYKNETPAKNWLQIDVRTDHGNTDGLGSVADVFVHGMRQQAYLGATKGFYSTSEPILHFGLGESSQVDSIWLTFPDGTMERLMNVKTNQRITWKKGTGQLVKTRPALTSQPYFKQVGSVANWTHKENEFVDFKRERLLPYMMSCEGPCMATHDVNGDGFEDLFIGNGNGTPSALFLQRKDASFESVTIPAFISDSVFEDCDAVIKDFDQDGDMDIVVVSGGNALPLNDPAYMARYYMNDGKGQFKRDPAFPIIRTNAGAVHAIDVDGDNDDDLLIAGRSSPGFYPKSPKSFLLVNDQGKFREATKEVIPELDQLGMITSVTSADIDGDKVQELILAGDWMPISIFGREGKQYVNKTKAFGLDQTTGWWRSLLAEDMDGDGDMDIVAGNIGLNHRMHTTQDNPITLVAKDFDGNGSLDPVLCFYYRQQLYPFAGRDAIIAQLPMLKKRFLRYTPYASASLEDIFTAEELKGSTRLIAQTFSNTLFRFDAVEKKFVAEVLPWQAQLSPVYDILALDVNGDQKKDLVMAGNFRYAETETGEIDAGNGVVLIQQPDGQFQFMENRYHGFWAQKEVRDMALIRLADGQMGLLTANNRGPIELSIITGKDINEF